MKTKKTEKGRKYELTWGVIIIATALVLIIMIKYDLNAEEVIKLLGVYFGFIWLPFGIYNGANVGVHYANREKKKND